MPRKKRPSFGKKRRLVEDNQIAQERVQILRKLIEKDPQNPRNSRYGELMEKIITKYKLFKPRKPRKKKAF